ncbi:uncharacterized protein LOC132067143 isoform X2 [Lycium ferocissimum]|uniref:uncharacterized protein LOC132067143 isoform X2 n=1 Tax=Lycium ferocissimum TaxID=112874 RepID=UPI002814F249|nr:uncharacterized protein LOC132067143 isoform X2 [Lycium ferocissimum]
MRRMLQLLKKFQLPVRKARTFVGIDETIESDNQTQFEDLLHTLNPAALYFGLFLLRCCVCLSLYALQVFSPTDGVLLSNCFILSKKITKTQYFRIRNSSTYSSAGFVVSNIANGCCNNQ